MKESFAEFYQPSEEQFAKLMQKGTVVLDANVLLNPYNVPNEGRDALLALLEKIKDRLWVPHQAGLEFQRNRARAIADDRKKLQQALSRTKRDVGSIVEQLRELDLDRRGVGKVINEIEAAFRAASDRAEKSLKDAQKGQPGVSLDDPVRDRLDQILEGRIGPASTSQSELDALFKDGEKRFALQIPPGFEDKDKEDHRYHHAGLTYEAKFGDFVIWKQTIAHVKNAGIEYVVLVTLDRKRDWWLLQDGKDILGPQPNLISEMTREGGAKLFWLLHLPDFMYLANKYLSSAIPEAAIDQVVASDRHHDVRDFASAETLEKNAFRTMAREIDFARVAMNWLQSKGLNASFEVGSGHDLVLAFDGKFMPVELLVLHGWQSMDAMLAKIKFSLSLLRAALASPKFELAMLVVDCDGDLIPSLLAESVRNLGETMFPYGKPISVHLGIVRKREFISLSTSDFRQSSQPTLFE